MKEVKIFGEPVEVKAEIASLQALSGHADRDELLAWMKPITPRLKKISWFTASPIKPRVSLMPYVNIHDIEAIAVRRGESHEL